MTKLGKIEKIFSYGGIKYEVKYTSDTIKCFTNEDDDIALITDKSGNILFTITADCHQNTGFLDITT